MAEHGKKLILREVRTGFFVQLLVRLLQLLLALLQLGREGLRLFQQIFCPAVCFYRVKNDSNTLC